jgi:acyl transferase domain-containing protein
VSLFDAPFFSITAKEAAGMDPMQRLLLEVAYECFENGMHESCSFIIGGIKLIFWPNPAGVPMQKLPGSATSVYCGSMTNDYELLSAHDIYNMAHNAGSGNGRALLSNRLSWFFDLRGPSITLDTACSSSLYGLHLACQSLRLGETKMALITGANLILYPNFMSRLSSMHMMSPEGISHTFDERANGYGRGEAINAIIIKPLKAALADGDTIRAVIRGTGANQDGKTPGITMPSGQAQADLIRTVYTEAGLSFEDTGYFEAHGTGTGIGVSNAHQDIEQIGLPRMDDL